VVSTWNNHITDILLDGAIQELIEFGLNKNQIHISKVPGAFELPLGAQWHFNVINMFHIYWTMNNGFNVDR